MKKNTLTGAQAFVAAKWLDENFEQVCNMGRPAVASMATQALGFTVTESNVIAAENTIGKSLARQVRSDKVPNDTARMLARELIRLQDQLGIPHTPALVALANR